MCGIFGAFSTGSRQNQIVRSLARHARQRGRDSSGLMTHAPGVYQVSRADYDINRLLPRVEWKHADLVMGHSRLITNGLSDNQPVVRGGMALLHNGIIVNPDEVWGGLKTMRKLEIDSEAILGVALDHLEAGDPIETIPAAVFTKCRGVANCALAMPSLGKLLLFSNSGSLFVGEENSGWAFSSERYPLDQLGISNVRQVWQEPAIFDIPRSEEIRVTDFRSRKENLIPTLGKSAAEEAVLQYPKPKLRRCTRCILPETMPYIEFDAEGVCNYCHHYRPRNKPKPKEELFELVAPYRRKEGADCILPFSGGRDSCYGLHLVINELKMKPITYTYDWGMVTDLGRRNISRMCSALGVENIIVAADISKKRRNIAINLKAWLKSPHLGMVSILTAGDKHFFRHVETVKKQTGIQLDLWGINPLEVTHFKAGFLGVKPNFAEKRVYMHGITKQLNYQWLRFQAMLQSPGYFNTSLWDSLSGEYYRSFTEKKHYFHIFDYWRWEEKTVDGTLAEYDWELAPDTKTTWRIGDGTAAFYNYIYYTVAGFTEHDTFRSNQIREGDLTREEALQLAEDENQPRYPNIKWYLDAIGFDFKSTIEVINRIPTLYEQ
jgi:glucosamine--fructose-6-phosphate aminotransferase (isomerizing)